MTNEAEMLALADYLDALEANMMKNDADIIMDSCDPPSAWADRLRAAARSAPDAGIVDRERFQAWVRDRSLTERPPFTDCSRNAITGEYLKTHVAAAWSGWQAALLSTRPAAAEPVAYAIYGIDGYGNSGIANAKIIRDEWALDDDGLRDYWSGNKPLYTHPAPSGRDPATIEAAIKAVEDAGGDNCEWHVQAIRALAAPAAIVTEEG